MSSLQLVKILLYFRAGLDKDVVDITLENDYKPIGIHFVHQYQQSGGPFESNFVSNTIE
jgi:hypothetical protein